MKKVVLLVICFIGLSLNSFSQSDLKWWNYTASTHAYTASGSTVLFDGDKTWIASSAGLTRYENNVFEKNYNGSNSGLTTNQITSLAKDGQGNIWLGTYLGGVVKYNYELDEWSFYYEMPFGKNVIKVHDIKIDDNDNVYVLCRLDDDIKLKLIKFDGQAWQEILAPDDWQYYTPANIAINDDNQVWVVLHEWAPNNNEYAIGVYVDGQWDVTDDDDIGTPGIGFRSISFDSNDNLWIQSNDAKTLIKYDGLNRTLFDIPADSLTISGYISYMDTSDKLWFTTSSNAILMFDGVDSWETIDLSSIGLQEGLCSAISVDDQGDWWVIYGKGFQSSTYHYDGASVVKVKLGNSDLTNNMVRELEIDNNQNKWYLHAEGLEKLDEAGDWTYYYPSNPSDNISVRYSMVLDQDGLPWYIGSSTQSPYTSIISFDGSTFHRQPFTESDGSTPNSLVGIDFDQNNNLWVTYLNPEVARMEHQTQTWEYYVDIQYQDSMDFYTPRLLDVDVAPDGSVWFSDGHSGSGLFSNDNGSWRSITTPAEEFDNIMVASNSDVWLGSVAGVDRAYSIFQYSDGDWITHDLSALQFELDPLNKNSFSDNLTFAEDLNGNIWIGGEEGLYKYDGNEWTWFHAMNSKLPCNGVFDIDFDTRGNMWLATICGVVVYNDDGLDDIVTETKQPLSPVPYSVSIKPNPASETILIELDNLTNEALEYRLVDVMGNIHVEEKSKRSSQLFDIGHLLAGTYFVQISIGDRMITKKFIKM